MSHRRHRPPVVRSGAVIEAVEARTLLSAAVPSIVHPDYVRASAVTNGTVQGFTPTQISAAYGFAGLTFVSGTVAANGAGQTIAIVDAYNDPNVQADLKVFDTQFDLAAPPSLKVVGQTGAASLPSTNPDWAGEIALDVEWAHAVAPGAGILLVEAKTDNTDDLLAATNYARSAAGVSVVSLSWGGSEFESGYNGGESAQQTADDATFTEPVGHQGVTFVSAAGDSGQQSGVQWPAASPNVVSVGGTTLTLTSADAYGSETGWSGTSSGYSQVESEPAYQNRVQSTGLRSVADVAYDGDPNTGVAVYDSLLDAGVSGWQEVGGTSAGTPQWAGLIAIADQGRVIAGTTTLNGPTQTLPDLYDLYAAPGATGYAAYADDFHDVASGGSGGYHFRHGPGGSTTNTAAAGYDLVTGLGSPQAAAVVADLATNKADTGTGGTPTGGGGSTPTGTTLSPIAITLLSNPKAAVIGGAVGSLRVRLTDAATTAFAGPVTVVLYASADAAVSADDTVATTLTLPVLRLRAGTSKPITLRFRYPTTLATGSYDLIALANATGTTTTPTTAVSPAVAITAPDVDLSVSFTGRTTADADLVPGRTDRVYLRLTNLGNVTAVGSVVVNVYASDTGSVDATSELLVNLSRGLKVAAGRATTFSVSFVVPTDLVAATPTLIAAISPTTTPTDSNAANDIAGVPIVLE